jgi:hypothetical protein
LRDHMIMQSKISSSPNSLYSLQRAPKPNRACTSQKNICYMVTLICSGLLYPAEWAA